MGPRHIRLTATAAAVAAILQAGALHAATINWGDGTGFWDVPGNWVGGILPGAADDAVINVGGLPTITYRTITSTVNSLAVTNATFVVQSGSLTVNNNYSNNSVTSLTGGTLVIGGAATMATLNQGFATLTLNGASTLGTLNQTDGQLTGTGALTVTGAATLGFASQSGAGTTALQGATAITSALQLDGGRVVSNTGTVTQTGNVNLNFRRIGAAEAGNGTITNAASGTWNMSGPSTQILASNQGGADTGAGAVFTNQGTFNRSGAGTSTVSVLFNNTGTLHVQQGTLSITDALTHSGMLSIDSGATLALSGGSLVTHTVNTASTTIGGTLQMGFSTLNFTAPHTLGGTGTFLFSDGQITGANQTFGPNLAANFAFGAFSGAGTTALQGATTIASLTLDGGRVLSNTGTVTQAGNVNLNFRRIGTAEAGNGTITNAASGTWNMSGPSTQILASNQGGADTGAGAVFTNQGTFNRSGAGTSTVSVLFNNTGTLHVQQGTLSITDALTHSGMLSIDSGATLALSGGSLVTHTVNTASTTIGGTLQMGFSTLNFTAPHTLGGTGTFLFSDGQITGANQTFGPNLAANFAFGAFSGAGTTALQGATTIASLTLDGGRVLSNTGTVTQAGNVNLNFRRIGTAEAGNGTITNAASGTWNMSGPSTQILASNQGGADTGAGAVFTNQGTFNRSGAGTSTVSVLFNNTGTLHVQQGTLSITDALTHSGMLSIDSGATLALSGGSLVTHTVNTASTTIGGTLQMGFSTLNFTAPHTLGGTGTFLFSDGQITGANQTFGPNLAANFAFGAFSGAGTTALQGATTIASLTLDGGRVLSNTGTVTQAGNVNLNFRRIGTAEAGNGTITNAASGTWNMSGPSTQILASNQGGADTGAGAVFTNQGTFNRSGAGTSTVSVLFNNTGTLHVQQGTLSITDALTHSGMLSIDSGATLALSGGSLVTHTVNTASTTIGGTLQMGFSTLNFTAPHTLGGTGTFLFSDGQITGANQTFGPNLAANFAFGAFSGAGTTALQGATTIASLTLDGGRVLSNTGTVTQAGNVNLNFRRIGTAEAGNGTITNAASGTWNMSGPSTQILASNQGGADTGAGAVFTNQGTFNRSGAGTSTVSVLFNNTGLVDVLAGTLSLQDGTQGTGTLRTSGGTLSLGAASTTGILQHNTNAANSLVLGTSTITVASDYNNANFGVGNAFNRRANVSTSGVGNRIIASGDVNQAITAGPGTTVINGATTAPSIVVGNVRVGSTTYTYNIANTGTTGPALRGAIQNGANGGNITDARLSGNGVLSSNWGAVAPGGSTARDITITINTAGVYSPISGQAVSIVNNFENTRSQLLAIGSSAGAAAFNTAQGQINTAPLNFGTVQVGQSVSQVLSISNTATGALGFVEDLNASFGASSGTGASLISGSGSVNGLLAGATNASGMTVSVNTSAAGTVNGAIAVNFFTAGAVNGVSNGLGVTAVGSSGYGVQGVIQTGGTVVDQANPVINTPTIALGNVRVGGAVATQMVSITNQATGDPQAALNASISTASGPPLTATGSFNLLNPGATNATSLQISMGNTTTAGTRSGTATVALVSDASNIGGCSPCQLPLPSQNVNITGGVYQVAQPNVPATVNLGNVHVGGSLSQAIAIGNTNVAPAGFQEGLNVAVGTTTGGATGSGSITNLAAGGSSNAITVGLAGIGSGNQSGTVGLNLASNGLGTSGLATLGLPSQTVTVNAVGYTLAQGGVTPSPVTLANQRVGGTGTQALTVANLAPNSAFTETLSANFGANTGNATNNGGSASGIAGGGNSTALAVGVNTSQAGARNGTVTVNLASNEVGGSGLGTTALAPQVINVSGNVYQVAQGQVNTAPLNFGTVQVGQSVSQTLSISNTATGALGFVEDLNASFGASSGMGAGQILGAGAITGLLAGSTNASNMVVSVNTATIGTINGSILVNFFTAGAVNGVSNGLGVTAVGSSGYGVQGVIQTGGTVVDQANPVINTPTIALGNVRVGGAVATQMVSITNQATGDPQAALNASISTASGPPLTATGSFNLLNPGATNATSLQISMGNTTTAGTRSGTATVALVSDASNIGGCSPCQLPLPSQNVNITGGVYQVAQPTFGGTNVSLAAARVGGTSQQALSITNTNIAPGFQEGLTASIGSPTAGIVASGGFMNLAAGGTNGSSLLVGLDTTTAGAKNGTASVNLVSTGAGTSGLADLSLGAQTINVSGNVYAPAVAHLNTMSIDFGIVRVGDAVSSRNVSVTNGALVQGLNDTLQASFGSVSSPFSGAGVVSGIDAGNSNASGSLLVSLGTLNAGVFNGSAAIDFASQNPDMSDLALGSQLVELIGQVNRLANPTFGLISGAGHLTSSGDQYVLDLGTLKVGTEIDDILRLTNSVAGPADDLRGQFSLTSADDFDYMGWLAFSGLGAGDSVLGLGVSFDAVTVGLFEDLVSLSSFSYNASDPSGIFQGRSLIVRARVVEGGSVPEPGSLILLVLAGLIMMLVRVRHLAVSRCRGGEC